MISGIEIQSNYSMNTQYKDGIQEAIFHPMDF